MYRIGINMIDSDNINDKQDVDTVIGIDLGTRNCCVSIWRNNRFEIIPDQFGNRTIPSVVSFYKSAKLVGYNALSMKEINPANTIYDIKRLIGRKITDPTIVQTKHLLTYSIIDDQTKHQNVMIQLDNSDGKLSHKLTYRPEELCAHILIEIKKNVAKSLNQDVSKAVITVPAYFNDAQRQATLDSAKIAGLDVLKIINEPTAAALSYGLGDRDWGGKGGNVIVYDLGAGTLDISLMNIFDGSFRTLAVGGSSHLGGEDIDYTVMDHVIKQFKKQYHISDLVITKLAQLKLKNSVENAKKILSNSDKAVVCVDNFYDNKKLYYVLTKKVFETVCNNLFIMCLRPLAGVLESASVDKSEIDDVILVGGSSRIPKIQKMLLNFFKGTKIKKLTMTLNPDEVVSTGAAVYGYIMTHNEDPFSEKLILLDVTPLSLGVETLKKQMTVIIPRNSIIPTKKMKMFSTDTDNQDSVNIKIFEGERKLTKYNFHVGTFDLSGFEKGPSGHPKIRITFHVDINGILTVTAYEKRSCVKNCIEITSTWGAKGRLSGDEIQKMIIDAEKNECIDNMYSLKIGLMHNINSMCESILINLKNDAIIMNKPEKKKIRKNIVSLLKWTKSKEFSEFTVDELQSRYKILTKSYTPLIVQIAKQDTDFKEVNTAVLGAEVHGDDENIDGEAEFQQFTKPVDPLDYENEEIKIIKNTIMEMCQNILSVVTNPVSNIKPEDVEIFSDYIDSVRIWLFTTSSKTTIQFTSKIQEINNITDEILGKYQETTVFQKPSKFSSYDELKLTCNTLSMCIESNYFTLKKDHTQKLLEKINEIKKWIDINLEPVDSEVENKINEINELCNNIYVNNLHGELLKDNAFKDSDSESESESDSETEKVDILNKKNRINEDINSIIANMPKKITKKKSKQESNDNNDIYLKIDIDRLSPTSKINYKKSERKFQQV